ncbi:MAG: zinc-ribbon domain containing protein [Firmicutes bacterium]|nr:zinc-ribbon domain containing protein [Bacillota bacterium]
MYQDKTLVCRDCGQEFSFTASEQEFFASKGFENEPSRCPVCRAARKQLNRGSRFGERHEAREMFPAICSNCGAETNVPFKPRNDRPVYCADCFQAMRARR